MRFSHRTLIFISGGIWLLVGILLLTRGISLLMFTLAKTGAPFPLLDFLTRFVGRREEGVLLLVALGLGLGFAKAKWVLAKSAHRVVKRIFSLSPPVALAKVYSLSYLLLLLGMIVLGISMKWIGLPFDIRGLVNLFVGSALVNGAFVYFRIIYVEKSGA